MRKPFEIVAKGETAADIYIYGDIGDSWFGESVTAKQFVTDLAAVKASTLNIRINSYGGSVTDGLAIYNAIKRHTGTKNVTIDGIAASIASLIAMAGDTVEIADNAMFMIHAPWGGVRGNAVDMRQYADLLDKWAGAMASAYAAKTGKPEAEITALLTDGQDHWYTAAEARDFGLADTIGAPVAIAASFDLSRFGGLPAAKANQRTKQMTDAELAAKAAADKAAAEAKAAADRDAKAKADAELMEAGRKVDITQMFARFERFDGAKDLCAKLISDPTATADKARAELLALINKDTQPLNAVRTLADEGDKTHAGIRAALEHKAGFSKDDGGNEFRGYTLLEMARASLRVTGGKHGGSKMEVVASAFTHSTSDFPKILENIANKSMLKGWSEADENFDQWTSRGTLSDFKTAKRVDLGLFPNLQALPEGAEYTYGTISERGESVILGTYGRMFSITRQTIINDDLSALSSIPNRMGRAAKRTVANLAYSALLDNPTMSDSIALFHASHNNLATGVMPPTTDNVQSVRKSMALQKDPDSIASAGLNIRLKTLLVPVALEGVANVVRTSEFHYGATTNNTIPNFVRNTFDVISDPRLDAASAVAWYGLADPNMHDGVQVNYLDGNDQPYMEQQNGWNVDGVQMKVRIDASAKCLDFRTVYKVAGA